MKKKAKRVRFLKGTLRPTKQLLVHVDLPLRKAAGKKPTTVGIILPDDPPGIGSHRVKLRKGRTIVRGFNPPDDPSGIGGLIGSRGGKKPSGGGV